MRTRNHKIEFWVNDSERAKLAKFAQACNMSRSAYMRKLITGYEPKAAPPYEYHEMMRELRAIGTNLNQIAHRAHISGAIDSENYKMNMLELISLTDELAGVFLPQKRGD